MKEMIQEKPFERPFEGQFMSLPLSGLAHTAEASARRQRQLAEEFLLASLYMRIDEDRWHYLPGREEDTLP